MMTETAQKRHARWRLADFLRQYPTLKIIPSACDELVLEGELPIHVIGPSERVINDEYSIEISIPPNFPRSLALVRETAKRIPLKYHKLEGDFLCLGTPTEQRLVLAHSPTLPHFVTQLLIPYLYGYSHYSMYDEMPYGEEDHGAQGVRNHLGRLYHAPAINGVEEFLRLTSLKKRSANKLPCPCQSGQRLGRCHNRIVNRLRRQLGKKWFRNEYFSVSSFLGEENQSVRQGEYKSPTIRETLALDGSSVKGISLNLELLRELTSAVEETLDYPKLQPIP